MRLLLHVAVKLVHSQLPLVAMWHSSTMPRAVRRDSNWAFQAVLRAVCAQVARRVLLHGLLDVPACSHAVQGVESNVHHIEKTKLASHINDCVLATILACVKPEYGASKHNEYALNVRPYAFNCPSKLGCPSLCCLSSVGQVRSRGIGVEGSLLMS